MGLFRHDDAGPAPRRFQMREEMLSIGDDYWIEDGDGHRAFRVNGKAMRVRDTWVLEGLNGEELAKIKERKLTVRDKMTIELGDRNATVTKRMLGIRDHFEIEIEHQHDMKAHGNVVDHEYEIEQYGQTVARVSKKWFRVRETYGVEIDGEVNPVLILAVTVAVDAMSHGH